MAGVFGSGPGDGVWGRTNWLYGVAVRGEQEDPGGWAGRFDGGRGVYARGDANNSVDIMLGGNSFVNDDGRIFSDTTYSSSDIWLHSNDGVVVKLDSDASGEDSDFEIHDASGAKIFNVDDDGTVEADGVVVHSSDRNRKEGIAPVDAKAMLENVLRLPIYNWRYKGQKAPHVGPMAQDFHAAFGLGDDDTHLATSDVAAVALAAIQRLNELVEKQQVLLDAQQADIEKLKELLIDSR
jgi:hypothetical protein